MAREFVDAWREILLGCKLLPTIPFVIGSLRSRGFFGDCADDGHEQFQLLFESMAANWLDDRLRPFNYVRTCHILEAPVFDPNHASPYYLKCSFPSQKEAKLGFSDDFVADRHERLESIVTRLYEGSDHAYALRVGAYSRDADSKTWIPFCLEE